jgi:diguanylate cyclase (GGDEF)-like protein
MNDTLAKIRELNQKADKISDYDINLSLQLSQEAWELLKICPEAEPQDILFAAINLSFCYKYCGNYREALSVAHQGLTLAEQGENIVWIARCKAMLGSIYAKLDDHAKAMDYLTNGLKILPPGPETVRTRHALNNGLGILYEDLKDYQTSLEYYRNNLIDISEATPYHQAMCFNNISYTLHLMGQNDEALAYSLKSIAIFNKYGILLGKPNILHTLGMVYLRLNELDKSFSTLIECWELSKRLNNRLEVINSLFGLSEVHSARQQYEQAQEKLFEALNLAVEIGSNTNQATAHELLSNNYKKMGDFQAAQEHLETSNDLNIVIFTEQSMQRIKSLQSIREQGNYYQTLPHTDALTGTLNLRTFFELAEKELQKAAIEQKPVAILMADIDHFKQIKEHFGHPTGEVVIKKVVKELQCYQPENGLMGRYARDIFVLFLPDMSRADCLALAEQCRHSIQNLEVETEQGIGHITVSLGLQWELAAANTFLLNLIRNAEQALLHAKQQGGDKVIDFNNI